MMNSRINLKAYISGLVAVGFGFGASAQEKSPIQSNARPFDLDIVAPVMAAGSDDESATFQKLVLPDVSTLLKAQLSESKPIDDSSRLLDPSKLNLKTATDVRVYFVGEGAGYRNTLGFNTLEFVAKASSSASSASNSGKGSGNSAKSDDQEDEDRSDLPAGIGADGQIIFPDVSSPVSSYDPAVKVVRTKTAPLLPGDFVDLGKFDQGTRLDFFLIADGARGGTTTYSTDSSLNPDGINHVVAFAYALKDSPYLIIGFEDLYKGGDRDFNDALFAIDIGKANIAALTATPEPATMAIMGSFVGLGWALKRRSERSSKGGGANAS